MFSPGTEDRETSVTPETHCSFDNANCVEEICSHLCVESSVNTQIQNKKLRKTPTEIIFHDKADTNFRLIFSNQATNNVVMFLWRKLFSLKLFRTSDKCKDLRGESGLCWAECDEVFQHTGDRSLFSCTYFGCIFFVRHRVYVLSQSKGGVSKLGIIWKYPNSLSSDAI